MAHELDFPTIDDGQVYLAQRSGKQGTFVLAVTDSEGRESEVDLVRSDLLRLIEASAQLARN